MSCRRELQFHEAEARRLRWQFPNDPTVHAVVALDLAVRRAACVGRDLARAIGARLFGPHAGIARSRRSQG